jgi:hypothetical protein
MSMETTSRMSLSGMISFNSSVREVLIRASSAGSMLTSIEDWDYPSLLVRINGDLNMPVVPNWRGFGIRFLGFIKRA